MKKISLLALIMIGGVMSINATSISRRIFIEIQGVLATNWSWKNQAPVVWIGSNSNAVSTSLQMDTYTRDNKSNKLYYADITGEDLSDLKLIITSGESLDDEYHAVTVNNVNLTETNKIFYVYVDNNKCAVTSADYSYKFIHWVENGAHIAIELTYDGNELKGTYSNSGTNFGLVFPSLVTNGGPFADFYWAFAHRPKNSGQDYSLDDFIVYNDVFTGSDKTFKFTKTMDYDLSFTISSTPSFTITPYRTETIGEAGYITFSNDEKYTVSNATAYTVSAKGDGYVTLNAQEGSTVFAGGSETIGTGIILGGSSSAKISAVASDAPTTSIGTNYLIGSGNTAKNVISSDNTYVLNWENSDPTTVGFYKSDGDGQLKAHRAYLDLSDASARSFLGFSFNDETGINEVSAANNSGAIYNLQGVRQNQLQKGLNIVNGKKFLVK